MPIVSQLNLSDAKASQRRELTPTLRGAAQTISAYFELRHNGPTHNLAGPARLDPWTIDLIDAYALATWSTTSPLVDVGTGGHLAFLSPVCAGIGVIWLNRSPNDRILRQAASKLGLANICSSWALAYECL